MTGRPAAVAAATATLLALAAGCSTPPAISPPSSPPAATTATAPVVTVSAPTAVTIPAIGAASSLIRTGLDPDGLLEVPDVDTPEQASWWTGSPEPGATGPAVLLGHVDGDGGRPGVFNRIDDLQAGDEVLVDRADATVASFIVDRVLTVPKADLDAQDPDLLAQVYGDVDRPELRLITCGGPFDRAARSYVDQVIVFAHLQEPS